MTSIDWIRSVGKVIVFKVGGTKNDEVFTQVVAVKIAAITKTELIVELWLEILC